MDTPESTMLTTRIIKWALAFLAIMPALPCFATFGIAEEYPSRTITLVVPFAAGGGTDVLGRLIAQSLGERLGTSVIVENKPGAGSVLGASDVAKARPDGYTLLVITNSAVAVTPLMYKKPPYDPMQDFQPLAMVSGSPFFLAVNSSLPVYSAAELIELAKRKPNELTYASAGPGSTAHIFMSLFMNEAGIQLVHVPYGGTAPAFNDVIGGHVDVTFLDPATAVQASKVKQIRIIGISTKRRSPALPDIPSISQTGLPQYDAIAWVAIVAPKGTPPEIVQRLHRELGEIVTSAKFKAFLETNGSVILDIQTVDGISEFFKVEIEKWGHVLRGIGLVGVQ